MDSFGPHKTSSYAHFLKCVNQQLKKHLRWSHVRCFKNNSIFLKKRVVLVRISLAFVLLTFSEIAGYKLHGILHKWKEEKTNLSKETNSLRVLPIFVWKIHQSSKLPHFILWIVEKQTNKPKEPNVNHFICQSIKFFIFGMLDCILLTMNSETCQSLFIGIKSNQRMQGQKNYKTLNCFKRMKTLSYFWNTTKRK